jgi:NAD+--asparagine ADP-ribosyltransferase
MQVNDVNIKNLCYGNISPLQYDNLFKTEYISYFFNILNESSEIFKNSDRLFRQYLATYYVILFIFTEFYSKLNKLIKNNKISNFPEYGKITLSLFDDLNTIIQVENYLKTILNGKNYDDAATYFEYLDGVINASSSYFAYLSTKCG